MSRTLALLALAAVALPAPPARATEAAPPVSKPPPGSATLPLAELLALTERSAEAARAPAPPPPLRASVTGVEISGRLLEAGLDATARVRLTVVGSGWVTVPLLELGPGTHLGALPDVEGGVLAVIDRRLCFVSDTPGPHEVAVRWLERPEQAGRSRRAAIRLPRGSPAVLRLEHDEALFRLTTAALREEGAAAVVHPSDGRLEVAWEQREPRARRAEAAARPPVEPLIVSAQASVVATLEGRRIARVLYRLRFEGERPFSVTVPAGQTVERVFLNGAARAVALDGGNLSLTVRAARAGEQHATVEVVTSEAGLAYPLSGTLEFTLPRPAWEVNELHATLHLPAVFQYRWVGGSLAAVDQPDPASYAWQIPTPGRALHLHQQLVSSFPTVRVAYTVDLAGRYYR